MLRMGLELVAGAFLGLVILGWWVCIRATSPFQDKEFPEGSYRQARKAWKVESK